MTIIRQHKKRAKQYKDRLRIEVELLETERGRIASDLHDELGPLLSVIKMNLHLLDTKDKNDLMILGKTSNHIDYTAKRLREISNNIMPYTLQRKGLLTAMAEMTELLSEGNELSIHFNNTLSNLSITKEKEVHIFRLFQEVLNNTIKHANASEIKIQLYIEKKELYILIRDNGCGFDKEKVLDQGKGLGLQNILRRAGILKGNIYLDTAPGKGTEYLFRIPL
ncbi:MAG: sensor histidine kinase [Chitinophagaceae bacterium]|nr:sensor histidine kinase [Chitinophagaceae bacterium]